MGSVQLPPPAILVVGILAAAEVDLAAAEQALEQRFGAVEGRSPTWPFHYTRYYERAMGPRLLRRFLHFERRIDPSALPEAKLATQELERAFAEGRGASSSTVRPVNLDPGYFTAAKLVLASTKENSHRVYLAKGIYAEVTLAFRNGAFEAYAWTYPDYKSEEYRSYFLELRARAPGAPGLDDAP
ncbi:MAG: DUF4416 family protein [Planctomycetes bacterium]|nr:DUF4416 family protein [Planctomycetota bacterium]